MAKTFDEIDDRLRAWIAKQPMFFVGSAPLSPDGHVNISPKGPIGTLRVLGPHRVAYLDIAGSGAETIAHLRDNGRIVVMFCAFEGPPRIVRLHGFGEAIMPADPRFASLLDECAFEESTIPEGRRSIIVVDVKRVSDSCGYGVPLMDYVEERPHMDLAKRKRLSTVGPEGMAHWQLDNNGTSLDGLPAVTEPPPFATTGTEP